MFKHRTTYTEFLRAEEGIATNVLADRLVRLEQDGIVAKDAAVAGGGYRLTAKGIDLLPILLEIIAWSAKHDSRTAADRTFVRRFRADKEAFARKLRAELEVTR
jgi:DNA-binding HxlR family transcriptional regulator